MPPFEERDHFMALGEVGRKVLIGCMNSTENMRLNEAIGVACINTERERES